MYLYSYQLVLDTGNVRDIHVVGGWAKFFELLSGEDIGGDEMDFGVTVLTSLGGRHVDDLARAALDDDVAVLSQGRTLHGEGGRCTGIGRIEGVLMLLKGIMVSCQVFIVFVVVDFGRYARKANLVRGGKECMCGVKSTHKKKGQNSNLLESHQLGLLQTS